MEVPINEEMANDQASSDVDSNRKDDSDNILQPTKAEIDDGDDAMSDTTLPADDLVEKIKSKALKTAERNEPTDGNNSMEIDSPSNKKDVKPKLSKSVDVKKERRPRKTKPKLKGPNRPGPKSSKRAPYLPRRAKASDRKHSTLISLGPFKHIKVTIEITGLDGIFSRIDGEMVYHVAALEPGKNQWKLSEILREVASASMAPDPTMEDLMGDDPYAPLHQDPPSSPDSAGGAVVDDYKPRPVKTRGPRPSQYECADCAATFKRKSDLTVHQRNGLCPAQAGPFLCDECGETLNSHNELKKHRKTHNRALCHLCGKTFPVGHCMKQHMITHAGFKPFDCDVCGAHFRSKTARTLHESTHKDDRPHICQICASSFKRIGLLKRHIKFVHDQAKDVRCKTCGRVFRSRSDLNAHLPSHTGEKRFCCEQCGKRFAYRVCLSDHVKTVHSDVRAYKCTECDKAFKTSSMLASHRRSHSKQASSSNSNSSNSYSQSQSQASKHAAILKSQLPLTNENALASEYLHQRQMSSVADFTAQPHYMTQRYMPQVGEYGMAGPVGAQNVFSPLRYLDLTGQQQQQAQVNPGDLKLTGTVTTSSIVYRDSMH